MADEAEVPNLDSMSNQDLADYAFKMGAIEQPAYEAILNSSLQAKIPPVDAAFKAPTLGDIGELVRGKVINPGIGGASDMLKGMKNAVTGAVEMVPKIPGAIGKLIDNPALSDEELKQLWPMLSRGITSGLAMTAPQLTPLKALAGIAGDQIAGAANRGMGIEEPLEDGQIMQEIGAFLPGELLGAMSAHDIGGIPGLKGKGRMENAQMAERAKLLEGAEKGVSGGAMGIVQNMGTPANDTAMNTVRLGKMARATDYLAKKGFFEGTQFDPATMKYIPDGSAGSDAFSAAERATNLVNDLAPVVRESNAQLSAAIEAYNEPIRLPSPDSDKMAFFGNKLADGAAYPPIGADITPDRLAVPHGREPWVNKLSDLDQELHNRSAMADIAEGSDKTVSETARSSANVAREGRAVRDNILGSIYDENGNVSLERIDQAKRVLNSAAADEGYFDSSSQARGMVDPSQKVKSSAMDVVYEPLHAVLDDLQNQLVEEAHQKIAMYRPELLLDINGNPLPDAATIRDVNKTYGAAKDAAVEFHRSTARDVSSSSIRGNTNIFANPAARTESSVFGGTMGKLARGVKNVDAMMSGENAGEAARISDLQFRTRDLGRQNRKLATLARGGSLDQPLSLGSAMAGNVGALAAGVSVAPPPLPQSIPADVDEVKAYLPQLQAYAAKVPDSPVSAFINSFSSAASESEQRQALASFLASGVVMGSGQRDGYRTLINGRLVNSDYDPIVQQLHARDMIRAMKETDGIDDVAKRMNAKQRLHRDLIPPFKRRNSDSEVPDSASVEPTAGESYLKPESKKTPLESISKNLEE